MKRFLSSLLVLCMAMTFLPASAAAASVSPFGDVQSTDWYYDEVQYVYENGLMSGTSATTFSPDATTTRGMIVTILHRLEGTPPYPHRVPLPMWRRASIIPTPWNGPQQTAL